jgi:integrase
MLFDRTGQRKYLTTSERLAFLDAADSFEPEVRSFCWTLASTGARITEVQSLTAASIDAADDTVVIECLKRRQRGVYRGVPVPHELVALLEEVHCISALRADPNRRSVRLWDWCRTTAWTRVKEVCATAGIPDAIAMPKAFRHAFGVEGTAHANVPLPIMRRWLGHVRLESTAVYCEAVGREERLLADRMWRHPKEADATR